MAGIKSIACKFGKHEWQKMPVPDNKYDMWQCTVCGQKKYNMGGSDDAGLDMGVSSQAAAAQTTLTNSAAVPGGSVTYDNLTGLMDRNGSVITINNYLKKNKKNNFTLCMCDIDGFTKLNETYEEKCGDMVLRDMASILKQETENVGVAGRWGGDEFLILFPSKNGDEVYDIMFNIRKKINNRVLFFEGEGISVTMSYGLAEYDFSGDANAFVTEAEQKLNLAKQMGGDQVVF